MAPADDIEGAAKASPLYAQYGTRVDNQSAREMLAERLAAPTPQAAPKPKPKPAPKRPSEPPARAPQPKGGVEMVADFLGSRQGKALQRDIVRGVFGLLKKKR
jgi:hypothetical protein